MSMVRKIKRQKRVKYGVALVSAMAVLTAACGSSSPSSSSTGSTSSGSSSSSAAPSGKPVNIGVIAGLTGPAAFIGKTFVTGTQTAANVINHNGGILGRPVKVISADDGYDPVDAVTQTQQMLATDNISALMAFAAPDWPNALPIVMRDKMVDFNRIGDPSLDHQVLPYEFRATPSDAVNGTAMAVYASMKGYKNVAVVLDSSQGAQTLKDPILAACKQLGINVVANVTLPANAGSLVAEVQNTIRAHPDAILFQESTTPGAGLYLTTLQQQGGGSIPLVGSDLTSAASYVKAAGAAYYQKSVVSIIPAPPSGPSVDAFNTLYQQLNHEPPENAAGNMFDSTIIAALAMDMAGSTDPQKYVNYITQVTTPGTGVTTVYTYAQGYQLIKEHKKIKYYGVSGPFVFTKYHTVSGDYQAVQTDIQGNTTTLATVPSSKIQSLIG
ncbi:MAG: amino acid ABC transporter substrate-binding protein [Actinomycetota bacterium]|nr:MAG: amino acid ABC transporter substrate-binding protein [Actinomycetota bacterium]